MEKEIDRGRFFVDHYSALGVSQTAPEDEIKAAFRKLAFLHHPDRSKDNGLAFIRLHSAYQILTDSNSRIRYDREYNQIFGRSALRPPLSPAIRIHSSRLIFPENIASLAKQGLLHRRYAIKERRRRLRIDYDLELPLYPHELGRRLTVDIPAAARKVCPECLGSDTECFACYGQGRKKTLVVIPITLEGGLTDGQILEIDLKLIRAGHMTHFKKSKIRILITLVKVEIETNI